MEVSFEFFKAKEKGGEPLALLALLLKWRWVGLVEARGVFESTWTWIDPSPFSLSGSVSLSSSKNSFLREDARAERLLLRATGWWHADTAPPMGSISRVFGQGFVVKSNVVVVLRLWSCCKSPRASPMTWRGPFCIRFISGADWNGEPLDRLVRIFRSFRNPALTFRTSTRRNRVPATQ